jgi:hypothetical protein
MFITTYTVIHKNNYHESYFIGVYETFEEAIQICFKEAFKFINKKYYTSFASQIFKIPNKTHKAGLTEWSAEVDDWYYKYKDETDVIRYDNLKKLQIHSNLAKKIEQWLINTSWMEYSKYEIFYNKDTEYQERYIWSVHKMNKIYYDKIRWFL